MTQTKAELLETKHQGDIRLGDANSSHYVGFKAPATVSSSLVWTLPAADGSSSQYLQTNGSGVLTWSTVSVGGASGIDFNDNVKARWGTGNDLEVFHNGSNSIINDAGTGDLLLQVGGATQATISSTGIVIANNLTVSGTTTTINTQTLDVEDKNVVIGKVSTPSDTTADGGGITLKGATDKTINWINSTDAWTFSEHINIASGKKLGVGGANYGTSGQVLTSGGSSTHPSWTTISSAPQITATADGAISAGQAVIMKSDGDVTKVKRVITVNNPPSSVANARTSLTTNNFDKISSLYIPELKKIIVAGKNENSGDDLEMIVGEVDDTGAFTWGSITQIDTDRLAGDPGLVYDPSTQRLVVLYYCDGMSNPEYSIFSKVITLDGNSISDIGSRTTLWNQDGGSFWGTKLVYDPDNQKIVAVYRRGGGNNPYSAVGTVTGGSTNTVSWGTPVQITSEATGMLDATYDPDTNRVLMVTRGPSNVIDAYVGTVSGTSISWGSTSEVLASNGNYPQICYDTENQKVVVSYQDANSDAVAKVGTVTGGSTNSISWGSASSAWTTNSQGSNSSHKIKFDSYTKRPVVQCIGKGSDYRLLVASGQVSGSSITFTNFVQTEQSWRVTETNANTFVVAEKGRVASIYRAFDYNNDLYSTSCVIGTGASNMTTGNFIGFANATASDNATATIDVTGSSNLSQSSLTAGTGYYVQDDGTLGTTASDPEQFAGTALSATKLLVRGYPPAASGSSEWTKLVSGNKSYTTGSHDLVEGFDTTYAAYKWFKIVWHFVGNSTASTVGVRVKSGGNWIGNNNYNNQQWRQQNGDDDNATNNSSNNGACARFHNTSFEIGQGETEFFDPMGTDVGCAFVSRSEGWRATSNSSTTGALGTFDRNHDMSIGAWGTNYGSITGLQWHVESGGIKNMYWVLYGRN